MELFDDGLECSVIVNSAYANHRLVR